MFARHDHYTPQAWCAMMELWTLCYRPKTPYPDNYCQHYLGHYLSLFIDKAQRAAEAEIGILIERHARLTNFLINVPPLQKDHRQSPRGVDAVVTLFSAQHQSASSGPTKLSEHHQNQVTQASFQ